MTWRGTILLLLAGILAAALLLVTLRTRTRPADAPLLTINPAETTGLEIASSGASTILENREGIWWITQPLLDRADPVKVAKIIGSATSAVPMDRLRPSDLKGSLSLESLDLKPPNRTLSLQGQGRHTLRFGAEGATPDRVYAQIDSDPSVYLVSSETATLSFRPTADLRDSRPFAVQPEQLSEITLQQQGGSRFVRLHRKGRNWMLEAPLRAKADGHATESWIGSLLGSRILRWMPADTDLSTCGLDTPEIVLTVTEAGGKPVRLELGKPVADTPGARYAQSPDRSGLFVLGGVDSWLGVTPTSLRLRHPSPVELDSVDRILLKTSNQTGEQSITLSRKPGAEDWLCGERTIPGSTVADWCARLLGTTATSFEAATPEHLGARGIDPAAAGPQGTVTIKFVAHLSQNSAEESAGEMTLSSLTVGTGSPDGTTALREGDSDDLMIIPTDTIRPLLDEATGWGVPPPQSTPTSSASPTPSATASPSAP